jgi:hypothetical protein
VTKTFTTPRFETASDRVIEPLALPGELNSGSVPELTTGDGLARGIACIGRFVTSPALLGVKVRPTGRPVRVTAHLRFDSMSLDWWEELTPMEGPFRGAGTPRLLLVRSQGKARGAVLLIRPAADSGPAATGFVSFDLRPEELTAEGLFVLEVVSIDKGRPAWAPAVSLGSVGVQVDLIEFTEAQGNREIGLVSTGNLPVGRENGTLTLRGGYFVANPGDGDEPRRWIARATLVGPLVSVPPTKVTEPVAEPVENRPSTARRIKCRVKRRIKRAARWLVPVAAVPVLRSASRRAATLERRVLRAAKRRMPARSAPPVSAAPPTPPAPPPPPPGPPHNPLADVMFELVSRNLVQVELAGVEPGPTPGVQVRARAGAEIEIVTDAPLAVPALIRLSVDPSVLREVPGVHDRTVRWDLVVRAEA